MNLPLKRLACTLLVFAVAAPTALSQPADAPARTYLSNEFVPEDAVLAVVGSPQAILTSPQSEMLPIEILQAQSLQQLGIDPLHIESVKAVAGVIGPNGFPAGIVLQLSQDYAISDLNPEVFLDTDPQEVAGRQLYILDGPPGTVLFRRDARTFFVAMGGYLEPMLEANNSDGRLAQLMTKISEQNGITAIAVMEPVRPMLSGMLKQNAAQIPPPLQPLIRLPELTEAVLINIQPGQLIDAQVTLIVLGTDESAAGEMEGILNDSIDFARDQMLQQSALEPESEDPMQLAVAKYTNRVATKISDMLRPKRAGARLTIRTDSSVASAGIIAGLMLTGVKSAHDAGQSMNAMNNLKQLALAMHNHHEAFKQLPDTAIRDTEGEPLLSWRVKILPFIEQGALYEQFHLDEPWDSEHNLQLLEQMPDVYNHPKLDLPVGHTVFQLPVGEELIFGGENAAKFRDITDGLSNTIMIVEADVRSAVPWTKPDDAEIDLTDPAANLSAQNDGGFMAAFADGAVRVIPALDPETLKALFTRAGGEVINDF